MDPMTIVGLVEGSISLAVQCGSVARTLNNLAGQYKYAKLTVSTMVQNLDIMQLAWDRIGTWSKDYMPTDNHEFTQRLERFLETGSLVLHALEEDLQSYDVSNMTFTQRSRLVWNEATLQGHQNRIRDQAQSMSLLLQAIQLPTPQATTKLLQQSNEQFMKSDESAFSIVPSRMSSRLSMSTDRSGALNSIRSYESLVYRRLSFEDDLFTARVYKRNYRIPRLQKKASLASLNDSATVMDRKHESQYKSDIHSRKVQNSISISSERSQTITEHLNHGQIMVSSTRTVSIEETDQGLEYLGSSSALDSYLELVDACGRGDSDEVERILRTIRAATSNDTGVRFLPGITRALVDEPDMFSFLGKYNCGSMHFCPIYATVSNGHINVMQTLLQYAESDNDISLIVEKEVGGYITDRWRPLHLAAMNGHPSMVAFLLNNGARVDGESAYGVKAIHCAAMSGSIEVLAALFEAGADVNCADRDGRKPLHYASESQNQPHVILYLAMKGANIDGVHRWQQLTSLCLACKNDFAGNLEALLSLRALANEPEPLLDFAIRHRSASCMEILLRRGLNVNCCRFDGTTGLHTFVLTAFNTGSLRDESADKRTLRLLLEHIDIFGRNPNGETLLEELLRLCGETDRSAMWELAKLFYECLPEYMVTQKQVLSTMLREEDRFDVDHAIFLSKQRSLISAPVLTESSLGCD